MIITMERRRIHFLGKKGFLSVCLIIFSTLLVPFLIALNNFFKSVNQL